MKTLIKSSFSTLLLRQNHFCQPLLVHHPLQSQSQGLLPHSLQYFNILLVQRNPKWTQLWCMLREKSLPKHSHTIQGVAHTPHETLRLCRERKVKGKETLSACSTGLFWYFPNENIFYSAQSRNLWNESLWTAGVWYLPVGSPGPDRLLRYLGTCKSYILDTSHSPIHGLTACLQILEARQKATLSSDGCLLTEFRFKVVHSPAQQWAQTWTREPGSQKIHFTGRCRVCCHSHWIAHSQGIWDTQLGTWKPKQVTASTI